MPLWLSALIFLVTITVTLIIVLNEKRPKKVRIAAGILGGIIAFLSAGYIILALILIGAVWSMG
jgi:uncharacterized membrane protein YhiD involved in acid resistance